MKILILASNPKRQGFLQRVQVYLDFLQSKGFSCRVEKLPGSLPARWRLYRQARNYDLVWLVKKLLTGWDAVVLRRYARRILYSYDDAVVFSETSQVPCQGYRWHRWMRSVQTADCILTGSQYLADLARPFHSNIFVLPIGLRLSDYRPRNWEHTDGTIRLVWIGSGSTLKYLEQIRAVLEELGRRFPNLVLRIIGDEFLELRNMPVEKVKWSTEGRREGLATSDIGLAPLPDTPFTRGKCSFKVLEYSASGLPVAASPIGTNAQYVQEGLTGYLAKDEEKWLRRLEELILDNDRRIKMGLAGREYVKQFDISVIGIQLRELLWKAGS